MVLVQARNERSGKDVDDLWLSVGVLWLREGSQPWGHQEIRVDVLCGCLICRPDPEDEDSS